MAGNWKTLNLMLLLHILVNLVNPTDGLQCQNIEAQIQIEKEITNGRVKRIYRGFYQERPVVLSYPADLAMRDDFRHGLQMLIDFQGSGFVTKLIGYCFDKENLKV